MMLKRTLAFAIKIFQTGKKWMVTFLDTHCLLNTTGRPFQIFAIWLKSTDWQHKNWCIQIWQQRRGTRHVCKAWRLWWYQSKSGWVFWMQSKRIHQREWCNFIQKAKKFQKSRLHRRWRRSEWVELYQFSFMVHLWTEIVFKTTSNTQNSAT